MNKKQFLVDYLGENNVDKILTDYQKNMSNVGIELTQEDIVSAVRLMTFALKTHDDIMKIMRGEGTLQGFHNGSMMVLPAANIPYDCTVVREMQEYLDDKARMDGTQ